MGQKCVSTLEGTWNDVLFKFPETFFSEPKTSTPSINHGRRLRAEEEERARREEEEEMARSENVNPDVVRWDENEDDREICGTVPIRER